MQNHRSAALASRASKPSCSVDELICNSAMRIRARECSQESGVSFFKKTFLLLLLPISSGQRGPWCFLFKSQPGVDRQLLLLLLLLLLL
ncbi:hypothetical protein MLD38_039046 [Melastoma candidum]|uniref:Uncharacterized protein n=1 Tax=Melastoma candidum TaxID=119954 RepID=A0ACB9L225_9MYRT|nr:hypothetical protein MLD38_039046 [Melastoma candidum]